MNNQLLAPPEKRHYLKELRVLSDLMGMPASLIKSHISRHKNRKCPMPVLLIPGFGGGERVMAPLSKYLSDHGFKCYDWGLGTNFAGLNQRYDAEELSWDYDETRVNNGELGVPYLCDRMVAKTKEIYEQTRSPVAIVGWSLGGCIAREVARDLPQVVSCVVTLGTPVKGGPKYTATAERLKKRGLDLDWIEVEVEKREANPIHCDITAIVSKNDGIVGYQSTLDQSNKNVKHIDVDMAHLGMVFNRRAWEITVRSLSEAARKLGSEAELT